MAAGFCIGIPQLQPVDWPLACPMDPPCMGIMVAPAGTANAVAGDAATASRRIMNAHALFRIIIWVHIHNCDHINLGLVPGTFFSNFYRRRIRPGDELVRRGIISRVGCYPESR
jgi:hypothetical protein